ncbi:hypothetical protein GCM10023224_42000 [Streptomonospora halophila]|uniref:Uncharacterized protein n=1 Tax=Streptomonospora halophila TaxID=427369 RepID=A0ABP9GU51_9ACTN
MRTELMLEIADHVLVQSMHGQGAGLIPRSGADGGHGVHKTKAGPRPRDVDPPSTVSGRPSAAPAWTGSRAGPRMWS